MTDYVHQARERWFNGIPGAKHAATFDPTMHFQIHYMDSVLALAWMAMEDEEVPIETRRRVINAVVYGSPNPADAELRMAEREQQIAKLADQPTRTFVTMGAFDEPLRRETGRG